MTRPGLTWSLRSAPCRDCYRLGAAVVNVDLEGARERWPLTPRAISGGFRSANALPLRLRSQVVGSLNLFHAGTCECRKPHPHHATRRYSLIVPPTRVFLRTR